MTDFEDKAAIIEILNLYAFALDAHRWDLFDRIFTDDVITEVGPAGAAWRDLDTLTREFAAFHKTLDNHQHTMMGHVVHVDGDKALALTYGNWLLVRNSAEGGPTWLGTGWYDDELIRTERGWRIRHRIARLVSYSGNPNVPEPVGEQNPDHTMHVLREASDAGAIRVLNAIQAS